MIKTLSMDEQAWKGVFIVLTEGLDRLRVFGRSNSAEFASAVKAQEMIKKLIGQQPVAATSPIWQPPAVTVQSLATQVTAIVQARKEPAKGIVRKIVERLKG